MGDDKHRQPLLGQLAHDGQHLAHHLGVQRGGRLVKQQYLGLHGQRAGNRHTLLLPAGKLARLGMDIGGHADLLQIVQCGALGGFLVHVQHIAQARRAVVQHRHIVEKVKALEHHAHLGAVGARVAALGRDVVAVEQHLAVRGGLQQVDAAQQGRFAAAGRADDAGDIAGVDGKIHIAQNDMGAEALGEVAYLNNRLRHGLRLPSYPDSGTHGSGPGRCTCRWCRPASRSCSGHSSAGRRALSPTGAADSWQTASSSGR